MADTKTQGEEKTGSEGAATTPAGIAPIHSSRVRIGNEPDRLSKGQRKHLRRQKEAGQTKVTPHRSQVSR